jgi:hypothetical protein
MRNYSSRNFPNFPLASPSPLLNSNRSEKEKMQSNEIRKSQVFVVLVFVAHKKVKKQKRSEKEAS